MTLFSTARHILVARLIFCLLLIYVTINSLVPTPDIPDTGMALTRWLAALFLGSADNADKVSHFLAYGTLGFFAAASRFVRTNRIWIVSVVLAAYGLVIEGAQLLGGTRSGSWLDGLANMLGAVSGVAGYLALAMVILFALKRRVLS